MNYESAHQRPFKSSAVVADRTLNSDSGCRERIPPPGVTGGEREDTGHKSFNSHYSMGYAATFW